MAKMKGNVLQCMLIFIFLTKLSLFYILNANGNLCNLPQFATICHRLKCGHLTTYNESMQDMFDCIQMLNNRQHHWSDRGMGHMTKCMHKHVFAKRCIAI